MNRQEAEKIKPEFKECFNAGMDYQDKDIPFKNDFESWFDETYPPEPEYIPFNWTDWKQFMGEEVKRKGNDFDGEIWRIHGLDETSVLIIEDEESNWKSYSSMFEEWEFADGKPFGKLKIK